MLTRSLLQVVLFPLHTPDVGKCCRGNMVVEKVEDLVEDVPAVCRGVWI